MITPEQQLLVNQYNAIVLKVNTKPELDFEEVPTQEAMDAMIAQDLLDAAAPYAAVVALWDGFTPLTLEKPAITALADISTVAWYESSYHEFVRQDQLAFLNGRLAILQTLDAGLPGFYALIPNVPNAALYLKNLFDGDYAVADIFLTELESKTAEIAAANNIKAVRQAKIDAGKAQMNHGRDCIALFGDMVDEKNMVAADIMALNLRFQDVAELLDRGALGAARDIIAAETTDLIFTEGNKTELLAFIDEF